ncbi:MAG: hypothetical protein ACP5UA_02365 [Candidatus Hydrogenedens sp.]
MYKNHLLCFFIVLLLGITSCNSYFENRKKPDNQGLSRSEQEVLDMYKSSEIPINTNVKKNIGDIESDLQILIQVPEKMIPSHARIQKEEGAHGKVSRIEIEIPPPYPDKLKVEVNLLPGSMINYTEYPVKVEGKIIQDGKEIGTFKTVLTGNVGGNVIPVPAETMFPMKFEVNLWDDVPVEGFSTLLYTRAKLFLYAPFTEPKKILDNDKNLEPIEETEVLGNPLRITLKKEGDVR